MLVNVDFLWPFDWLVAADIEHPTWRKSQTHFFKAKPNCCGMNLQLVLEPLSTGVTSKKKPTLQGQMSVALSPTLHLMPCPVLARSTVLSASIGSWSHCSGHRRPCLWPFLWPLLSYQAAAFMPACLWGRQPCPGMATEHNCGSAWSAWPVHLLGLLQSDPAHSWGFSV